MTGKIQIVVGGQFGSEGKGHAAAELIARESGHPLAIRTGGPNAGHTCWDQDPSGLLGAMQQYKLRQLPVASVANRNAEIALAAGSLVNLELLDRELEETNRAHLWVDRAATILEERHIKAEGEDPALRWGSTQKGIGAARMDRLHRTALVWGDHNRGRICEGTDVATLARVKLQNDETVQIEAAQGYGLGLHTSFYPKTTSADCRVIDALADVGLSPWEWPGSRLDIWVVIRPSPIRVAGASGPLKGETTWAKLGLSEERTTVTNKVRRVGEWDGPLVADAVAANGGGSMVKLWLNMADQIAPGLKGATDPEDVHRLSAEEQYPLTRFMERIQRETGASVWALGTGPDTAIILD